MILFLLGNWRRLCILSTYWLKGFLSLIFWARHKMIRYYKVCILILSTLWQRALSILLYLVDILIYVSGSLEMEWVWEIFFLECNYFKSSKTKWEIYTNCKNRPDIFRPDTLLPFWLLRLNVLGCRKPQNFKHDIFGSNFVRTFTRAVFFSCSARNAQQSWNMPKDHVSRHSSLESFEENLKESCPSALLGRWTWREWESPPALSLISFLHALLDTSVRFHSCLGAEPKKTDRMAAQSCDLRRLP